MTSPVHPSTPAPLLLGGGTDYIVSEDHDLRRLREYDSIVVLRKHEFLQVLEAQG